MFQSETNSRVNAYSNKSSRLDFREKAASLLTKIEGVHF